MEESSLGRDRRKVCFLSGQEFAKKITADVHEALKRLDVVVLTTDDISSGMNMNEGILDALASADFVCIVIPARRPSLTAMYEAGLATGMRRPLLVVAEAAGADNLPTQLLSAPTIRYKQGMTTVLRDNLSAYVMQVQPVAAQHLASDDMLFSFSGTSLNRHTGLDSRLDNKIASHFEEAGAIVALDRRLAKNMRPDIIATFPSLGAEFSPIIIEIKSRRQRDMGAVTEQMRKYLLAAEARLGLIVTESDEQKTTSRVYDSRGILYVSADHLLAWDRDRLLTELTRLRNKVVHSV
jgi:hypothetical protein